MEDYVREAPQAGSLSNKRLEYRETEPEPEPEAEPKEEAEEENEKPVEEVDSTKQVVEVEEAESPVKQEESPRPPLAQEPLDLLGLNDVNPEALKIEESNALALAILQPDANPPSSSNSLVEYVNTTGWELALVTAPSNLNKPLPATTQMAGGFDKLLLDSLYEDDAARRTVQLHSAGYNASYDYDYVSSASLSQPHDPFAMSNNIAPPTNVQLALMSQQEQMIMMQQQQQQQQGLGGAHNPYTSQFAAQSHNGPSNPFGDPFGYSHPPHSSNTLI